MIGAAGRRPFTVERTRGSAAAFHARAMPEPLAPSVWVFDVDRPAIALGSRQTPDAVDAEAARRAGVEVVRRRSGGGAVLLVPGEVVWLDVLLPASDPRWTDDVHAAMVRLGDAWRDALDGLVEGDLHVHRWGLVGSEWSDLVCFAGVGPGEVLLGGRKLVGISQRRTRAGARFQCAVHRRFDAAATSRLLSGPLPPLTLLPDVAELPSTVDVDVLVERLVTALDAA